jgi:hypothetical protein
VQDIRNCLPSLPKVVARGVETDQISQVSARP